LKGINCCGDCGLYNWKKHMCTRGATKIEGRSHFYNDCPLPDVAPVVHGRWVGDETMTAYDVQGVKTWAVKRKCTKCGFVSLFIEAHMYYDFCPKCGAKMDGESS